MKLNEPKFLIFLSTIMVGFLIASEINFGKLVPREFITFQTYQQMTMQIKKLDYEINMLNIKRKKLESDIYLYKYQGESDYINIDKLSEELNKYEFNIGLTDVKGPGIVVSLADNADMVRADDPIEIKLLSLIHDRDILQVVCELKNAGAEEVSVNGQRIIQNTEIDCDGPVITINKERLVSPFIIKAIGDPDTLSYALNNEDSYYSQLQNMWLKVDFKKESSILIPKYDRYLDFTYAKAIKE